MNEEEIIENVKQTIEEYEEVIQEEQEKGNVEDVESGIEIKQGIQGLLDLYKKEKERANKLQRENEEIKGDRDNAIKLRNELIEEQKITCISKNKIRDKIKEVAEEPQIYVDTEQFDKEFEKSNYIIEVLNELLGE